MLKLVKSQLSYVSFWNITTIMIWVGKSERCLSTHCCLAAPYGVRHLWSTLVQVKACCLWGGKSLLNQCWLIANWTSGNKFQWIFIKYANIFSRANVCGNAVCKMSVIFCRPECVKCHCDLCEVMCCVMSSMFVMKINSFIHLSACCFVL